MYFNCVDARHKKTPGSRCRMRLPYAAIVCVGVLMWASTGVSQVFRGYGQGTIQVPTDQGKRRQTVEGYYPNGNLRFSAPFRKGRLDGTVLEYHESGILKAEVDYKRGERHGTAYYYHPSGILMARIRYRRDQKTGMSRFYDEQGVLSAKLSFRSTVQEHIDESPVRNLLGDTLPAEPE